MYFQRKCIANITAQYSVNADQTIGVLNSCRIANGEIISSEGVAYSQNQGNSKLKVSFLPKGLRWIPFTKGHYWVLRVDPEYKVALVGGRAPNTCGFCRVNRNWMKHLSVISGHCKRLWL
jgi:apolipoprotein D and lipocalin family protein